MVVSRIKMEGAGLFKTYCSNFQALFGGKTIAFLH